MCPYVYFLISTVIARMFILEELIKYWIHEVSLCFILFFFFRKKKEIKIKFMTLQQRKSSVSIGSCWLQVHNDTLTVHTFLQPLFLADSSAGPNSILGNSMDFLMLALKPSNLILQNSSMLNITSELVNKNADCLDLSQTCWTGNSGSGI